MATNSFYCWLKYLAITFTATSFLFLEIDMLTYWKITFTIALVAVLVGTVDRMTPYKCKVSRDLLTLAFMAFVAIGLSVEVWA